MHAVMSTLGNGLASSLLELNARKAWALATLGIAINEARAIGGLPGEQLEVADPAGFRERADRATGTAMQQLAAALELTPAAVDLLWLLACIEVEPILAGAAQVLFGAGMHQVSVQTAERLVAVDAEERECLERLELIEIAGDARQPMYRRAIRVTDRVLAIARGARALDPIVAKVAELVIPTLRGAARAEVAAVLTSAPQVLVVATGPVASGRTSLLLDVLAATHQRALLVRAADLPTEATACTRLLRAIARECRLHALTPVIRDLAALDDRAVLVERDLLRALPGPVLATARETCTWDTRRALVSVALHIPDEPARAALWQRALSDAPAGVVAEVAGRYTIAPGVIMRAARIATAFAGGTATVTAEHVHTALRGQLERSLVGLARRIEVTQTWDDVVLPPDQFDLLIELVARVRHRHQVLDQWGFGAKVGKGRGVTALLSGPPGTGKTMIAGLVARELGLDLYQIDLSKVVSKFIGETEKQLSALFDAAESGHAILLFDEADSLFGKRTDVKSSNDRNANLEVNYLLQRLEAFHGIALLTTNHETAIDAAFQRRLAFHVRVPMPDLKERALIWSAMLPAAAAQTTDVDVQHLARSFVMSGGYIKNAVLRAAFLAADAALPIAQEHLVRAAQGEYQAMGRLA